MRRLLSVLLVGSALVGCRTTGPVSSLRETNPDTAAAEKTMASLTEGKAYKFNCFSFEEFGPTHVIKIYETTNPNFQYVLSYQNLQSGAPAIYRYAASDLQAKGKSTLFTDKEIKLRLSGHYGANEIWKEDGQLYATKQSSGQYALAQDFNIASRKVTLKKDQIACQAATAETAGGDDCHEKMKLAARAALAKELKLSEKVIRVITPGSVVSTEMPGNNTMTANIGVAEFEGKTVTYTVTAKQVGTTADCNVVSTKKK